MSGREPKKSSEAKPPPGEAPRDVVFVYGRDDSTGDYGVVRHRDDRVELGRMSPMREGQPIHGELIKLEQRPEDARLFDVEVVHDARAREARSGPPRVSSAAYRASWDRIFGDDASAGPPKLEN